MKIFVAALLLLTMSPYAFGWFPAVTVPEIDGSSATASIALIAGGMLVLRARRRK